MDTVLDSLVVKIRADTTALDQGLASASANLQGLQGLSENVSQSAAGLNDSALGFTDSLQNSTEAATARMGAAFERMARAGRFSFQSLESSALSSLAKIVTTYAGAGLDALFSGGFSGGGLLTSILPGRAGGGSVSPGEAYMVGERGPELFIPAASGRIAAAGNAPLPQREARRQNITINIQTTGGADGVRQSAAQVARAVRRAISA